MHRRISIVIPSYNRPYQAFESFDLVKSDPRINFICILDDASTQENQDILASLRRELHKNNPWTPFGMGKNESNFGMQANKASALRTHYDGQPEWAVLLDDDNSIGGGYIDAIFDIEKWDKDTIYCPSFAKPNFDYRKFEGMRFDRNNVRGYLSDPAFKKLLNTCNYFLHRDTYLSVYQYNPDIKAADTIWFAYNWLKAGKTFEVVPGMHYEHTVHEGSGWKKDIEKNRTDFANILQMIKDL
jgi:glycosyltransferase involved in cell wall biosynthesis